MISFTQCSLWFKIRAMNADGSTLSTSTQELFEKGQKIYDTQLKDKLEPEYTGKFVAIDIETAEYFIGDSLDEALGKARGKYPSKIFHSVKVGSTGVFTSSTILGHCNQWLF